MSVILFIDESGHDLHAQPYEVLAGVAIEIPSMTSPARPELANLASLVLDLRYQAVRDFEGNPSFVIWSFATIDDLRTQLQRGIQI